MCSLRDESSQFSARDVQVFGVSVQDAETHRRFAQRYGLGFPLLVDTDRTLSLLFGATDQPDGMSSRMTVVIDKAGTIVKLDTQVNAAVHGKDLIDFFDAM